MGKAKSTLSLILLLAGGYLITRVAVSFFFVDAAAAVIASGDTGQVSAEGEAAAPTTPAAQANSAPAPAPAAPAPTASVAENKLASPAATPSGGWQADGSWTQTASSNTSRNAAP
jgi:hypothetical protein